MKTAAISIAIRSGAVVDTFRQVSVSVDECPRLACFLVDRSPRVAFCICEDFETDTCLAPRRGIISVSCAVLQIAHLFYQSLFRSGVP